MRFAPPALALVAVLLAVCGCGPDIEVPGMDAKAEEAWARWVEDPNDATYYVFIDANRTAAMAHDTTDDAVGILMQVRALEAMSQWAATNGDLNIAQDVIERADEIDGGGVLEAYDEALPGAAKRVRDARAQVAPMLQ